MKYSCIHTHSLYCDGGDDIETLCREAFKRGLVSIGFSSHGLLLTKTGLVSDWHLREDRAGAYMEEVRSARRRWEGKLQVFLGLEVDYISGRMGPADREIQALGLDYIIGSVHYVVPPKGEPFTIDGPAEEMEREVLEKFGGDGEAVMETYWDSVEEMIRAGGFDVLGHLDVIKKNNFSPAGNRWFDPNGAAYQERIRRIIPLIASSGLVTEVNTGGLARGRCPELYPSPEILALLGAHKAPVTVNADAHLAGQLGGCYAEARQALLAAGYTHALLFEGREQGRPLWTADPL